MSRTPFPKVEPGYPFPRLELEVLERWRRDAIFDRTLEKTRGGPEFVFYEGPPTANNVPHVGHVVTRVVKDLIPRYRTMKGEHVRRKGGWDTHGLPVEIEVEKKLGFTEKAQIEDYGIAEFNRLCLESVDSYEKEWRRMVERVGHWIDLDDPYFTYKNTYIESEWWALSQLAERGRLDRGYKIQPYCGRCGTSLSSHEVAQNYKDIEDPSVWVLFPTRRATIEDVDGRPWELGPETRIVAWTTTPWTLLSHAGLAVNPGMSYRLVEHPGRQGTRLLIGADLKRPVPVVVTSDDERRWLDLRDSETLATFAGTTLEGLHYDRPFQVHLEGVEGTSGLDEEGLRVVPADYVTADEGTGVVHTAPLYGEDDYATGRKYDLVQLQAVDETGAVVEGEDLEGLTGLWFKEADPLIVRRLKERERLLHTERHEHNYPFCWRCDQPLLYFATTSWFIRTTLDKEKLIGHNRKIAWHPSHVGEGRFGKWLENVVDWALSRSRYWGTPLPVWLCDKCDARTVIGSYEELFTTAGLPLPDDPYDPAQFDPHRPGIDGFSWPCIQCDGGIMTRVEDVVDAWFDSGSMPFAQLHYPFENRDRFEAAFPADFISEAVDQTRGWFFTMHALGTLLFDSLAFKNCIVLGHVGDESGRKMSKRLGNVVDPMAVVEEAGADALRWYFCINNPTLNARFSGPLVREAAQGFQLPLWNALSFFSIYANLDGWRPQAHEPEFDGRPPLDRWILLRLGAVVGAVTEALDAYRIAEAAREVETFLGELTNWYIRRSRDRFWAPNDGDDNDGGAPVRNENKESAYQALYEVLTTLAKVLAPFTPFLADVLHEKLVRSQSDDAEVSVHLESWPEPCSGRCDDMLVRGMQAIQCIVRLGHAARNTHGLKTRQPLRSITVVTADPTLPDIVAPYEGLLKEELNLRSVDWTASRADYVHHEVVPIFPRCGPRFGKKMPLVKKALEEADGDALVEQLDREQKLEVVIDAESTTLSESEVEVRLIEREGHAVESDGDLLVALDIELDSTLVSEGLAREVVHRLQNARKEADLDYADRIRVVYRAGAELGTAIEEHSAWIAGETLAVELGRDEENSTAPELVEAPVEGQDFAFRIDVA